MFKKEVYVKKSFRRRVYIGENISYETKGWWGNGPVSFSREYNADFDIDNWTMSTSSGGQNDGDVIDKIRELRAILDDAEEHILSSRAGIKQEADGMEIVELA